MIKRTIFTDLKKHLSKKEISLIIGPRQAGKTTLMRLLEDDLKVQRQKTLFLNLDFETDKQFFNSQKNLISKIQLELGKSKGYVFIDEIQRKKDAGLFLKGIYDLNLPYKFIVSGSGSIELKEKIHESLLGRKQVFELNTISFQEFVNFKTGYKYERRFYDFLSLEKEKAKGFLIEYLNFGGYPRLVLEEKLEEKRKIINEIYQSILEKDISYLLKVDKTESFSLLIKILAEQAGKLINYSELSSTLGISVKTVKDYLWYAQKIFILRKILPFFRNTRKEITKSPSVYFYDLGFRNYSLGNFGNITTPSQIGFIFQNFILNIMQEKLQFMPSRIHFWRTKDKAEVDFVIELGKDIIPIEVKYKEFNRPQVERSMHSFLSKYKPKQAWIINISLRKIEKAGSTKIKFMPFYDLFKHEWPLIEN